MRINYNFLTNNLMDLNLDFEGFNTLYMGSPMTNYLLFFLFMDYDDFHNLFMDFFSFYYNQLVSMSLISLMLEINFMTYWSILSQLNSIISLWYELIYFDIIFYNNSYWFGVYMFLNILFLYLFFSLYLLFTFLKMFSSMANISGKYNLFWNIFMNMYFYMWTFMGDDKTESVEEILCLIMLWPWCMFLVFTHMFITSNHSSMFGFAEWGLPMLYGLILLAEHFWTFGTYILVYLLGIRGRSSFIMNLLEDMVSMLMMFASVMLQSMSGMIVSMFHFMCREALLNLVNWWNMEMWFNHMNSEEMYMAVNSFDLMFLLVDFFLAAGSLVVVMAIMFLQLIFLIVSVWLFCKCWFISWSYNGLIFSINKLTSELSISNSDMYVF